MPKTARIVCSELVRTVRRSHSRPRPRGNVVRLHRVSKAARVFSEIAKTHITHPLPDQLQLAEEELRVALDEMHFSSPLIAASIADHPRFAMPSKRVQVFFGTSACGFWALMIVNALRYFSVF